MYPVTFKAFVVLNEDSKRDIEGVYYSSEFHIIFTKFSWLQLSFSTKVRVSQISGKGGGDANLYCSKSPLEILIHDPLFASPVRYYTKRLFAPLSKYNFCLKLLYLNVIYKC